MESKGTGSVEERPAVGCVTLGRGFTKDGGNLSAGGHDNKSTLTGPQDQCWNIQRGHNVAFRNLLDGYFCTN